MQVITTLSGMHDARRKLPPRARVGFVATMGALHEGHASLVRRAKKENDHVIVSIFVNPSQFGPREDFNAYPRTFQTDAEVLKQLKTNTIFYPGADDMYPPGFATSVYVNGLSKVLEGRTRPTHFEGVTTVVAKLFHLVRPDKAYFGEKDFQQLAIIRRMTSDLSLPIEVVGCPIVREEDGLALSSRNAYLASEERTDAKLIFAALTEARRAYRGGEHNVRELTKIVKQTIRSGRTLRLDYVAFVDAVSFAKKRIADENTRILIACSAGKTRLIDNIAIAETDE